jgi:DNA-binding response OmpR family regulator
VPSRLGILDTDSGFVRVLAKRLRAAAWEHRVLAAPPAGDALVALRLDAIVVDPDVLGADRWAWLDDVRARLPDLGVIVCTGPSSVADRVRGLRQGADDWVAEPCHPEEVIARVEAIVRRRTIAASCHAVDPVLVGELEIRPDRFQVFAGGAPLPLTRRQFVLVRILAEAEGRVLERDEIYRRVWGYAMARGDRSVDVFVRKLRKKFEQASPRWRYIHRCMLRLSSRLRRLAGERYPLGAIIPDPVTQRYWPRFPYAQLRAHYDVLLPMAYWTFHRRGAAQVFRYTRDALRLIRSRSRDPSVSSV